MKGGGVGGGADVESPLYASSSKPMPTLCPPALKFFPSMRAERVTLTPAETQEPPRITQVCMDAT